MLRGGWFIAAALLIPSAVHAKGGNSAAAREIAASAAAIGRNLVDPVDPALLQSDLIEAIGKAAGAVPATYAECLAKSAKSRVPEYELALDCAASEDPDKVATVALTAIMAKYDPQGSYVDATTMAAMRPAENGPRGGVGLSAKADPKGIEIVKIMQQSPLIARGVAVGDRIVAVNGASLAGMTLDEAILLLRGVPDSMVTLRISAGASSEERDIAVVRRTLEPDFLQLAMRGDIAILTLESLPYGAGTALARELERAQAQGAKAIILDLRGNSGGLLDEVVACADRFLETGLVMEVRGRGKGDVERYKAAKGDDTKGLPLVVLIDRTTASGGEMLAAALQDHGRAQVVGETSYKRGSIQTLLLLSPDTALRLTTAEVTRPNGQRVTGLGVTPDVVLSHDVTGAVNEANRAGSDVWLEAAVKAAGEMINGRASPRSKP